MTRTLLRAAFAAALATTLATTLATGAASTAAAPVAASGATRTAGCVEHADAGDTDDAGASARVRPGRAGSKADNREVSRAEQLRIDARTKQIVQDTRADRTTAATGNSIASKPANA